MARDQRMHLTGDNNQVGNPLASRNVTKGEFAQRLYKLMNSKGLRQTDLVAMTGIKRDSISTYCLGKTFPGPFNLAKIAKALDVQPEELIPNFTKKAIEEATEPDLEMRMVPGNPGLAWLRLNKHVKLATAVKIVALLEADATEGS